MSALPRPRCSICGHVFKSIKERVFVPNKDRPLAFVCVKCMPNIRNVQQAPLDFGHQTGKQRQEQGEGGKETDGT